MTPLLPFLVGWSISTCLLHQYHFVAEPMNWTEAQTYCREKYTDLATIENTEEMNQLVSTISSSGYSSDVWIGLYSTVSWRCSACSVSSVCFAGTQLDPEFIFVNEAMNWSSAQRYCRENFTDLATVRSNTESQDIQNLVPGGWAWIGLFRDPNIYWSDGSSSSFRSWNTGPKPIGSMSVMCGAAALERSGRWTFLTCETRLPFVCYSISPPAPVKKQVVKVRIKAGDSVDLNNPAVKANILKEFQDRLKEKGVSGVTLKWREQPDGKVFHKEEKHPQKKEKQRTEL
ncbi:hypothetical protein L3Q82_016836 [Scortum barcoo]|uniref:Uncharacterized protein n=1 Tax=Scortum barcoo TaxID=214431 RepID=A0ACB8X8I7_9TELE|nr:hypothetical protein L3Q82_016836 [Scortum barcoo]